VDKDFVEQVVAAAASVVASGAISANGHGNVSVRVPGAEEMYYTAAPSLRGLGPDGVVRVGLDGTLLEGSLPPIQGAVVAMHTAMYQDHPDVGCVLHTHSPFATAHAVAQQPIDCWIEALAMFGLAEGVPVAAYGPRGSRQAIASTRRSGTSANATAAKTSHATSAPRLPNTTMPNNAAVASSVPVVLRRASATATATAALAPKKPW
jgi:L-fuculose-phosphate aldolase